MWLRSFACCTLALAGGSAVADPGYYLVSVYSDAGLRTVDFRYWTTHNRNRPQVVWPEVGYGYGVNDRWYTELFLSGIGPSPGMTSLSSINWQNDVLLTQGQYPVDLALHTQLIRNDGKGNSLEYGPALQTELGRTQLNLNFIFDRNLGDAYKGVMLKYQWQLRHHWQPWLNFGVQGFGELGRWDDMLPASRQSNRAGPALYGRLDLGERSALHWQAAWLTGKVFGKPGQMLTMQAKYVY